MGTAAIELWNLNAVGIIGSCGTEAIGALICQKQGGHGYHDAQQHQSRTRIIWFILRDLWHQLVDYGISGSEIDGEPTKLYFDLYQWKSSGQVNKSVTWIIKTESWLEPDLRQFTDPESLQWRNVGIPMRKTPLHC